MTFIGTRRGAVRALCAAAAALVLLLPLGAAAQVGGLTALPAAQAPGPNRVENAGFETGGGAPAGWKLLGGPDVWSVDHDGHSGRSSLMVRDAAAHKVYAMAEQEVKLEPGEYVLQGWVKTRDLGANDKRTGVRLCLDARPRMNWWMCTDAVQGTTDWTLQSLPLIPVRDGGAYRVTVGVYGQPDGTAWFDDVSLTAVGRPPLDAFLLYPNFRGMLFDDRPQVIRVALSSTAAGGAGGQGRVRLGLLDAATGAVLRQREYPMAREVVGELDATGVPGTTLLVRAELLDGNGTVRYRCPDYQVVKVPPKARSKFNVWYDERNVTYLRGKPSFIIGMYNTTGYSLSRDTWARGSDGWADDRIAEAKVNMLINYFLGGAPMDALYAYLDDLWAHGIHYLQTVNFYHRSDPSYEKIAYPAAKQGEDALNRYVASTLGRHQALAGFYTADERPAQMVPAVFQQRQALAASAPGTVTFSVLGNGLEGQAPLWRDAVDVLGLDPYPITRRPGTNNLALVGDWTRMGRDAVMNSRPVWMVLQFFPLTSEGGWPTYDDLRTMSWMAIVEGARGLFYWSFGSGGLAYVKDPKQREQHWNDLVRVTKDIKALEPVLLAPDADVVSRESSGGVVHALGKRMPDGTRYLFAYNSKATAASVTWTLAQPATAVVDLDGGQAPAIGADGTLGASFGAFEVKRYRIR